MLVDPLVRRKAGRRGRPAPAGDPLSSFDVRPSALPPWLCGLAGLLAPACGGGRPQLPNVVVVVIDTLRADHLPFHGYQRDTAPFLGEWAERSVVFERAWSTSSWTAPATASLFTGVYPNQHGVTMGLNFFRGLQRERPELELNRIPESLETLPEFLRSLGYRTFAVADNPNVCEAEGFRDGFERFESADYEGAPSVNHVLAGWSREIRSSRPFFVYLHYMDPHLPYHPRAPWFAPVDSEDVHVLNAAAYDSEIRYCDEHVREAFALLGVDEETVVIITADHGEEFGDHGGRNHLFQLYSELTHVPLLIHHPHVQPLRRRVPQAVSLVDILPTLRSILGAPASDQDQGIALTPLYLDDGPHAERTFFAMRSSHGAQKWAVVEGNHKYIFTEPMGRAELYDLSTDPREKHDLVRQLPDLAGRLHERWSEFERRARRWQASPERITLTPEELQRLSELGYGGDGDER